ncbi:MAG TPA: type II secretion system protein [Longimicrobium sp.]|nr:type II secretion system protein [Longimicrobium sp.]
MKTSMQLLTRPRAAAPARIAPPPSLRARRRRRTPRFTSVPAYRRGFAPGYTLIEMIGVVIIAAILLKMAVPNLLGGSEAARKNALINDLKGYHSQAALHYQDFQGAFPTAIQATGTPTAGTMTYATSPGVGLRVTGVTQAGYTVRARSTELRKWECTMTISKTSGYNPVCTELAAEWVGTDPAA